MDMVSLRIKQHWRTKLVVNDSQIIYFIWSVLIFKTEKLWLENYQTKTLWYAQLYCSSKSPMVAEKKSDLLTMKCFLLKRKNERYILCMHIKSPTLQHIHLLNKDYVHTPRNLTNNQSYVWDVLNHAIIWYMTEVTSVFY